MALQADLRLDSVIQVMRNCPSLRCRERHLKPDEQFFISLKDFLVDVCSLCYRQITEFTGNEKKRGHN